jgi:hypothetical protein
MENEDDCTTPPIRPVDPSSEAGTGGTEPEAGRPDEVGPWFQRPLQWFSNRRPPKRRDRSK